MPTKPARNNPSRRKTDAARSLGDHTPGGRALDILDSALGRADALLQQLFPNRAEYESVSWREAVRDLERRLDGRAAEILGESALSDVEARTRKLLRGIEGEDSFSRKWAADSVLARCCYLACRLAKPEVVVETGVAYGVSSAFVLAALEENGFGELHSLDLRPARRQAGRFQGIAVPDELKERWTLYQGSSRRKLPGILRDAGKVDLFLHDSLHTKRNMLFEFDLVWPALRPGAVILADDVERNEAFGELGKKEPSLWRVVKDRETEPLHGNKAPVAFGVSVK